MIVVDASVAVQWAVPEPDGQLEAESVLSEPDLQAPDLLLVEVANALRRKVRDGEISVDQALRGYDTVAKTVRTESVTEAMARRGLELAIELNHSVYDCIYVVFAAQRDAQLATRDHELQRRLVRAGHGNRIVALPLPGQLP